MLAACLLATVILYPHLVSQIPTHWNARGQADHYGAKWTLLVIHPGIMLGMLGLFAVHPWLSPQRFEAEERVWNATHRLAGKTFILGGPAALILSFAGLGFWVPFAVLVAGALVLAIYSLVAA